MLIILYRILFWPIFLIMFPYYGYRMWKRGGYLVDFKYRFGLLPVIPKSKKKRIWVQAVSVGEVKAVGKLLDCFERDGRFEIFLTTTSSTGYTLAKKLYTKKIDFIGLFPWDFWVFSMLAWKRIQPDIIVLMEGEVWPEHIHQAKIRNVPVFLVNARLSDKTYNRYLKYENIATWLFSPLRKILTCSEDDLKRFVDIGVDRHKVQFSGNLKFDVEISQMSFEKINELKLQLGFSQESHVLLGSSTWPGEEKTLLQCLKKIRSISQEKWNLLLVPRHAERRYEIINILKNSEFSWHQRSSGSAQKKVDVCLADTTGELAQLTNVADIVFIGKSLFQNKGGQSPLDAAACGIPIVYGDKMTNFSAICRSLESLGGVIKVADDIRAIEKISTLANDANKRQSYSKILKAWYQGNCGASELTYKIIAGESSK